MTSPTAPVTNNVSSTQPNPIAPPSNFSIYNLTMPHLDHPTNTQTDWILNIDRSGSMDAPGGDDRTRMDHVKHMVKNFVDYLQKASRYYRYSDTPEI